MARIAEKKVKDTKKAFATTGNKGFHLTFPNGITLSTQFGPGNYCENYNKNFDSYIKKDDHSSMDAEVAIFDSFGTWKTNECTRAVLGDDKCDDDVQSHVTLDQWLLILEWCKNYKEESR